MLRTLWLLRHGEAVASVAGRDDAKRQLTALGRQECFQVARLLDGSDVKPELILASPARRAAETADLVVAELRPAVPVTYEPTLYLAEPPALLAVLQRCGGEARALLVIGHNPGLSEFAQQISGHARAIELRTAGLCRMEFRIARWSDVGTRPAERLSLLR